MTPIHRLYIHPLESLPRIRWLGPDGGWRSGIKLHERFKTAIVLDERRQEIIVADAHEFEPNGPRDDEGNPQ